METIAAGDEIAGDFVRLAASAKANFRLGVASGAAARAEIVDTYIGCFQKNLAVRGRAGVEKIGDDFILRVNRDRAPVSEFLEVDAMGAAAEAQPDAIVRKPFVLEPVAYTGLLEQVDSSLLEQAGAHPLFDILAAARFDDGGLDPL